jgi:hypothetical protein
MKKGRRREGGWGGDGGGRMRTEEEEVGRNWTKRNLSKVLRASLIP